MSDASSKKASSHARVGLVLSRGNAIRLLKEGKEPFPRSTLLLPDSDVSLGELMEDEKISYMEAMEVMFALRTEAGLPEVPEVSPDVKAKKAAVKPAKASAKAPASRKRCKQPPSEKGDDEPDEPAAPKAAKVSEPKAKAKPAVVDEEMPEKPAEPTKQACIASSADSDATKLVDMEALQAKGVEAHSSGKGKGCGPEKGAPVGASKAIHAKAKKVVEDDSADGLDNAENTLSSGWFSPANAKQSCCL